MNTYRNRKVRAWYILDYGRKVGVIVKSPESVARYLRNDEDGMSMRVYKGAFFDTINCNPDWSMVVRLRDDSEREAVFGQDYGDLTGF